MQPASESHQPHASAEERLAEQARETQQLREQLAWASVKEGPTFPPLSVPGLNKVTSGCPTLWGCSMVCIGKNIANCSKNPQFLPVMCALCPRCAHMPPLNMISFLYNPPHPSTTLHTLPHPSPPLHSPATCRATFTKVTILEMKCNDISHIHERTIAYASHIVKICAEGACCGGVGMGACTTPLSIWDADSKTKSGCLHLSCTILPPHLRHNVSYGGGYS